MAYDWTAIIPSTVGGLIGGGFAVVGMAVAGRRERVKQERERESAAVRGALQQLLGIEDLFSQHRGEHGGLSDEGLRKHPGLVRQLEVHVAGIRHGDVRVAMEKVARTLDGFGVDVMTGDPPSVSTYHACAYGKALLSAYQVGDVVPAVPARILSYVESADEYVAIWEQEQQQAELGRGAAGEGG